MPYSFKLLVHDIKIQVSDSILLSNPSLSVTFANYPKMIIKGKCPISNVKGTYDSQKAFGHGKSVLLHLDYDRMTDILREQPLEILLINDEAIIAGARIKISHFIPDMDGELKFKRGNFHLLDHFGKPYALADLSISFHDPDKIPEVLKAQQEELIQQAKLKQQQEYIQSLGKPTDPEPIPDQIVYNKNKKQQQPNRQPENQQEQKNTPKNNKSIPQKQNPPNTIQKTNIQQRPVSAAQQIPQNIKSNQKQGSQAQSLNTSTNRKSAKPLKSTLKQNSNLKQKPKILDKPVKANPNSVIIPEPEELVDIPITQWINTLYCPPPMFLDKKVYVHKIYNAPEEQVEKFVKPAKTNSVAIQTEFVLFQNNNDPILRLDTYQDQAQTPNERAKTQTQVSDNYQEDFESFVQSQSQANQSSHPKSKTPRVQPSSSNRRAHSIQEAIDEDVISDIYSEDFEQASQSQTFKRSLSKKDEISESYIPDFESISQSQQFRRK